MAAQKLERRAKIKLSIRQKVSGTAERPRLSVFRSNTTIYAQLIDDVKGHTLASASSVEIAKGKSANISISKEVGKKLAEKALQGGVKKVVFDRNGYLYHGKVKSLADGAREGGLEF
jgi:large subunit ribosomal protein L18